MKRLGWLLGVLGAALSLWDTEASILQRDLDVVNARLQGRAMDFTRNHGRDNRIWSPALGQKRDLYVYLPPAFDATRRYPLALFLHGAVQDEQFFLDVVGYFDEAMANGRLFPGILAAPDGSILGRPGLYPPTSIFLNTRAGRFEDYLLGDVWNFLVENFPVSLFREDHSVIGVSMGGMAAFTHGIRKRDRFKAIIGFFPAVNMRWVDGQGRYETKFDPQSWGWRSCFGPHEIFGRAKLVALRFPKMIEPLFGYGQEAIDALSQVNPIELIDRCKLLPGELDMYIAYGGQDEFNIDTQVESFLHHARSRGLKVDALLDPQGKHDVATGLRLIPQAIRWADHRLKR